VLNSPKQNETIQLRISGRVQGVGYRYAMRSVAQQLGITGWVRNMHDGSVEAMIQGNGDALADMAAWCAQGPAFARVDEVSKTVISGEAVHEHFKIRG
jgi:acylphosphatase